MSDWHSAAREADGRTDEEIMAEIKYRADTGAGTPHQHQSFRERDACPECRAAMAAARSRPATDPAGLDVERLRGALTTIRDLCDMDHDEMDAEFGSEQRVRIVVIPAVVDDAIGTRPMSEGLRRVLFRLFSYLGSDLPAARLSVADGPGPEERPDLEAAWAEAEAVLPQRKASGLYPANGRFIVLTGPIAGGVYWAHARLFDGNEARREQLNSREPSGFAPVGAGPAAALRALAAALHAADKKSS